MTELLRLPRGWTECPSPDPDLLAAAVRAPVAPSGTRPSLTLRIVAGVGDPSDLPVPAGDLEDEDDFADDDGHEVVYLRWSPAGVPGTVCESWSWATAAGVLLLTACCDRRDYLDLGDVFESVAQSTVGSTVGSVRSDQSVVLSRPA